MAITLAKIDFRFDATQTGSAVHDTGGVFRPALRKLISLTDGTGADQADILFADVRTVGDGANDDIDLSGALSDAFGTTVTAAEMVALMVINEPLTGAANTTALTIGAGANPFVGFLGGTTPTLGPIQPGGAFMIGAGHASGIGTVTAATADILRVANAAGAANTYQIAFAARTA